MKLNPLSILKGTKGKIVKVVYTNQKGETKSYSVRTGVKKHVTGYGMNNLPENSIRVFSMNTKDRGQRPYKTFFAESIQLISQKGMVLYSK